MRSHDAMAWMLAAAVEKIHKADQIQRYFLTLGQGERPPCWEPLVDMVASQTDLCLMVALPGVAADDIEVAVEGAAITVVGERRISCGPLTGEILRLELPYGRFERRIRLPYGNFRLVEMQLESGCLRLRLEQVP